MENKFKVKSKHYSSLRNAENIAISVLEKIESGVYDNLGTGDFKSKTNELKAKLKNGSTLDDILVDAFALAYKAIEKVYKISLYKVQIMGGYILHQGDVAEMRTGEGKTLTAILPAYLNALTGEGVAIITVNEYLSTRDAFNTGKVFTLLGLTIGSIKSSMKNLDKKKHYSKDIFYVTNSEIGFDYLRDNLVKNFKEKTQKKFNFAIIDEVDSILIDESRTPLIISGGSNVQPEDYMIANDVVKKLGDKDYELDKESKQVFLTHEGSHFVEKELGLKNLYEFSNSELVNRIHNALQAHHIFKFDVDYTIRENEIVLIDIFTGRLLEGRQYSNGLNQAIEAKENLPIKPETKTYASITYQNLFRMFKKLSGMSGTALPEEEEFLSVYNMRVIPIPTNKPVIREDKADVIFSTQKAKFDAVVKKIEEIHKTSQPILVGTRSVFDSEEISKKLHKLNIIHEVLNAKNHSREAEIISKAGKKNAITISTNMAGRGTDIKLDDGVIDLGGLFVLGTERHESRRIDQQLRGRSGRQGDIGVSQFYVSLEDEIMNRSGLKRIQKFMNSLDTNPIESKMVAKSITVAQKKLEGLNFDYRKSVVEYDDVLNTQRLITYKQRDSVLHSTNFDNYVKRMIKGMVEEVSGMSSIYKDNKFSSEQMIKEMNFNIKNSNIKIKKEMTKNETIDYIYEKLIVQFEENFKDLEDDEKANFFRNVSLFVIDGAWQTQIERLSRLKIGIRYRQYAQRNPMQAYVLEADKLFTSYKNEIMQKTALIILRKGSENGEDIFGVKNNRDVKEILVK